MHKRLLFPLLCVLCLLTGCVSSMPEVERDITETLPPVRPGPAAPIGDSQAARESSVVLYLPDPNTSTLTASVQTITIDSGQSKQEACVEALLQMVNESGFYTGNQLLRLMPVSNAVESTGELVTVNLHTSVRSLSSEAMFALRVSITNTLTELPGVNYVNVLVDGRDIGLDLAGTLPTGVLSRYPSGDVSTLWRQMETQRAATDSELQKVVALYFVSEDGLSLLGELRDVTFSQRNAAEYARVLLDKLTISVQGQGTRVIVPSSEWFERDPIFVQPVGASMGYIEVHFTRYVDDHLLLRGATRGMLLSSICYTLTSFIPQLDGVVTYINGEMVTTLELMDGNVWSAPNGIMRRRDLTALAADTCTVYFPLADGAGLSAVTRPIAQRLRTQPRALLRELMKPPTNATLGPALPEGISDADVLGIKISGDTALLNVTESFARLCADLTETEERNMVYSIVNTLTEIDGITRVRFYVNGEERQLTGHLFMQGEFMRHTGIIR